MEGMELNLDNILSPSEVNTLFNETEETQTEETEITESDSTQEKEEKETTEVDVNSLFTDEPESVGSGNDNKDEGMEDTSSEKDGSSPENFYSSIANALKEEGVFPDLDDETLTKIQKPEDFKQLIENQIKNGLSEKQKRIDEALGVNVEPSIINKYENTLDYLSNIKEDDIRREDEEGEKIRKSLIYQDFINRGYSKERALKEIEKSLNAGTDVDDAIEALNGTKEFFTNKYKELVNESKQKEEEYKKEMAKKAEDFKKSILEDKQLFGEFEVDKATRQKIFDVISKPVHRDENGKYLTELQNFERNNSEDFLKFVGLAYTLTDGFKNFDGLTKNKVKKEVNKGLKHLENVINNTARTTDGNLNFASGVKDDMESFIGKGWSLDI